jgi:hypothetical protein
MKHFLLTLLVISPLFLLTELSFTAEKPSKSGLVFAYASSARHLVAVDDDLNASQARRLTKAICPTSKIASEVSLTTSGNAESGARAPFEYDAINDVPVGNYCLLVDEKAHPQLFAWGSGDEPLLLPENACRGEITQAAERLTGRTMRTCYLIGGYGTGHLDLVEYVSDSPANRLVALLLTDYSLDRTKYSIARFPANSPIWSREKNGKFHPERFRHLFTISHDPDSKLWTVAVDWAGPSGHVLTLFRPVGSEMRPLLVNHDAVHRKKAADDIASR